MSNIKFSLEVFPPRNLDGVFVLAKTMGDLALFNPLFTSVTYGAGGTTRQLTAETAQSLHAHYNMPVCAHLTCVGASRKETLAVAQSYADAGIKDILALRGDMPQNGTTFKANPDGFSDAPELISALAQTQQFNIRVSAYPDMHPDSIDPVANVLWLKRKFEAGASSAITQFFFEPESYFRFRDLCEKHGVHAPIIPGILPITSWNGAKNFAKRCGVNVPPKLMRAFEKAQRDKRMKDYALAHCCQLCDRLIEGGVDEFHFYTLNQSTMTQKVLQAIGLGPKQRFESAA